ncbi:MAG: class I SAM-dependent methyltransferase [Colwellia sp.]|nr:class I SAM-dependent methyltransferase [Colwellia sp.]
MKTTTLLLSSLLILIAPVLAYEERTHASDIDQVLKAPERPQQDKARDAARKPADILALVDIKPNMAVVDFIAGRGYYTDLFARILNNSGKLYSVKGKLEKRDLSLFNNISVLPTLDLSEVKSPVDRIFTALNYHDIINKPSIDRQKLLKTIYGKLKDDGYFIVIDHNAAPGTGKSQTKKLHRVENTFVLNEITSAGFILDRSLSVLANPNDTFAADVWQESTKGKTDRFVYRFKKSK